MTAVSASQVLHKRLAPEHDPTVGDTLLAAGALFVTLAVVEVHHTAGVSVGWLGILLATITCAALLAHRRSPLGAFIVSTAASAALNGLGYSAGPPIAATIALFYVASDQRSHERIRETATVVLGMFVLHIGATTLRQDSFPAIAVLGGIVVWGGAWIVGDQLRQRRQHVADLVERTERADREMKRERELAAAQERTRIARDLHDSAAHAINVILVQAGAARLLQERDRAAAKAALTTIEEVARETIGDIDRLIRGLRDDDSASPPADAIEPPTTLAALETLAERHRAAGLEVTVRVEGQPRALAPGVDQAAYRIVQESLTNAARYGNGDADVDVVYGDGGLQLIVSNSVAPSARAESPEGGHGIIGMRERAELLGGGLDVARGEDRFRVHARMAYPSSEAHA